MKHFLLFLTLVIPSTVYGQCAGVTSCTAASLSSTDVATAINSINTNGTTLTLPAGSATWTAAVTATLANNNVTIQGSGCTYNSGVQGAATSTTIITDNYTGGAALNLTLTGAPIRLTCLQWTVGSNLRSNAPTYSMTLTGNSSASQWRMDNVTFNNWTGGNNTDPGVNYVIHPDNIFGLFDHLTSTMQYGVMFDMGMSSYQNVGANGDNSWAQPDTYGSNSATYIEDSVFTSLSGSGSMAVVDCDGNACRFVVRHTTLSNAVITVHGSETPGRKRGARQMEAYNNTVTNGATGRTFVAYEYQLRSGIGLIFNDTVVCNSCGGSPYIGGAGHYVDLSLHRQNACLGSWGCCDGSGAFDDNDGTIYVNSTLTANSICPQGTTCTFTDNNQSWSTNQWVQNGDPYSGHDVSIGWGSEITSNTNGILTVQANAHYGITLSIGDSYQILRASICLDQPGRGQGVLMYQFAGNPSLSPSSSVTGWVNDALDPVRDFNNSGNIPNHISSNTARIINNRDFYQQNNSFTGATGNGSGLLSARPATCTPVVGYWATDTSTLYLCNTTNTWTSYYTPYTYPHPLQAGGTACFMPSFSPPPPATFVVPTAITLTAGCSAIIYTTNGTTPTESACVPTNGTLYTVPFTLFDSRTVLAIACQSGLTDSGVASATYTIPPAPAKALFVRNTVENFTGVQW